MSEDNVIYTKGLTFQYPNENKLGLNDINISLNKGEKMLLVGPNGAGKSTLLKILAGKKLIKSGEIKLFGINPFDLKNNFKLNNKTIIYLGTEWANNEITKRDIKVSELIESVGGKFFIERRDKLIELLEINCNWRMNRCSDGERRRVQLCMGLLKPFDLLLLDEVTIDLDVLVRERLLEFLYEESENRGCCIIYATHIFDGLGRWGDVVVHVTEGRFVAQHRREDIVFTDSAAGGAAVAEEPSASRVVLQKVRSLYPLALMWLSSDRAKAEKLNNGRG